MQTICKITPDRRADDAAWLSALVEQHRDKIKVVDGCKFEPPAKRRDWIDPDYQLRRERKPPARTIVRLIAANSTQVENGIEVIRTAHQVTRELNRQGIPVDVAHVELYARQHRIRLRSPSERRLPPALVRGATKQARDRAVLREEWT